MSWTQSEIEELKEACPSGWSSTYSTSDGIMVDIYVDYMILYEKDKTEYEVILNKRYTSYTEFKRMANMKAFW